tara:strand:+ start:2798 stop:3544 length:747 start_codon:yes stop_codon:yes gene_type:complete
MSVTNDPDKEIVFTDGETEPQWFYDLTRINFVKTDKDVTDYKQFPEGSFVLCKDGFVRQVLKKCFGKKGVPFALYSNTVRDGMKCCPQCVRVFPISHFVNGHQVRSDETTAQCSTCRKLTTSSRSKPGSITAERKAYIDKRRLEIIKSCGCQWHEGCDIYQHVDKWSDKYIMKGFEFNHIDDTTRLEIVSKHGWFTDNQAKKHGFKTWKEFWEAEVAKCEVLCKIHHGIHSEQQRTRNRKRAYAVIVL